jgi:hypothetical protein
VDALDPGLTILDIGGLAFFNSRGWFPVPEDVEAVDLLLTGLI